MAAHQASPPSPDPLSLSFLLSFSACIGKLQVAEEAMPGACVRPCVRVCVRVRCITHAARCEAAIYGQWLQMNKAANSFDKLHCRLLIMILNYERGSRGDREQGERGAAGDKAACRRNATVLISQRSMQVAHLALMN